MGLAKVVGAWCGAGVGPDEGVAAALVTSACRALHIDRPAGSAVERGWQVDEAEGLASDGHALARALVGAGTGAPVDAVRNALVRLRTGGIGEVELFRGVAELWGAGRRPIVIAVSGTVEEWVATVQGVTQAVEVGPPARLILLIEGSAWDELHRRLDPHAAAVLHQGLAHGGDTAVREAGPAEPSTAQQGGERGLAELGERARRAVRVAMAVRPAARDENDDAAEAATARVEPPEHAEARSLAEALLFAALQADARTAGLFALNRGGGFAFGPREAEIDLLCGALAIAVEVDGYFHFQDPSAYRRDRAKDWLMQRRGLLVLRFLAADVVEGVEAVVDRVAEAVALRRSRRASTAEGLAR